MNARALAQTAYATSRPMISTDRGTEYDIIARVTRNLATASQHSETDFASLARALQDNRELWTVMAVDLVDPENALPPSLKAQLLSLAHFTEQHIDKVLFNSADTAILIEINKSVMRGLINERGPIS